MKYVIQLVAAADGSKTPLDGQYVVDCNVGYYGGGNLGDGHVRTTTNIENAMFFDTFADAYRYWMRVAEKRPNRPDGKPNRPLTAYTIQVQRV